MPAPPRARLLLPKEDACGNLVCAACIDCARGMRVRVQWRGLPYAECTWETLADITAAGGRPMIDEFQTREARLVEGVRGMEAQARPCRHPLPLL